MIEVSESHMKRYTTVACKRCGFRDTLHLELLQRGEERETVRCKGGYFSFACELSFVTDDA